MTKDVEVIPETDYMPVLSNESLLAVADRAEKQVEAVNKIKKLALKVTNAHDWIDQQGKPYLGVSGAEKVARLFGISWTIGEPTLETEPDGHFAYTYKGVFTLGGASIEAIGTRSSKDGFFKRYAYSEGEKTELPPSECDKGDLKKSAYTNLLGNGITRLLGIRNLTWEEVEAAGISKDRSQKVAYGKKEDQDVNSDQSGKRQEHNRRIKEALVRLYGEDKKAMGAKVVELTTWTPTKGPKAGVEQKGKANYETLSDIAADILMAKLEKLSPVPKETGLPIQCADCGAIGSHENDCRFREPNEET